MWDLVEYLNNANDEKERNTKQAFAWLKQLVARNDGYAHYVIGNYYSEGFGTEKNDSEAMKQYVLAAEQGIGQAQAIVGRAYLAGNGMPHDVLAAINWSMRAAERGDGGRQADHLRDAAALEPVGVALQHRHQACCRTWRTSGLSKLVRDFRHAGFWVAESHPWRNVVQACSLLGYGFSLDRADGAVAGSSVAGNSRGGSRKSSRPRG